jgi:uncharacterized protein (TIGR02646 family)
MIHVDRSTVTPPEVLTDPNGRGPKEIKRAIEFYASPANQNKSFDFKAYSDPDVKLALNTLFKFKCAYCESYYGATQPVDIEHFRPKGAVLVNGKPVGRGYYWLAADWENLLPSCIDCNRPRTQEIFGGDAQVQGKATEFPIADEKKRAAGPGQEKLEKRLLLNPCLDDPKKHLVFEVQPNNEVIVRPAVKSGGKESQIGKESIRVYALQRQGLVAARRDRILLIKAQVARLNRLIRRLDQNPNDEEVGSWLQDEMQELDRLLEGDQPYAGMARQYVDRVFGIK